jgi:hypothetical protein
MQPSASLAQGQGRACHPCVPAQIVVGDDGWAWTIRTDVEPAGEAPRRLIAYWQAKRADRVPVSRRQIDPLELPRLLPHLFIARFDAGRNDYVYTLIGTGITRLLDVDRTGAALADVFGADGAGPVRAIYDLAVAEDRPVATAGMLRRDPGRPGSPGAGRAIGFEAVQLPIRDRDDTAWMILGGLFPERGPSGSALF